MIEDYSVLFEEDYTYEYDETWPVRKKGVHYPLNGPYSNGLDSHRLLSFSPGNLASFNIFDDVKVLNFLIYGKAVDNDDDREGWADPIRMEILRRIRYQDWIWYIAADGWHPDPSNPDGFITLEKYLHDQFYQTKGLKSKEVRSYPNWTGKMVNSKMEWTSSPGKRTFFEIPDHLNDLVCSIIWSKAVAGHPIEGYQLPPGSLERLSQWGEDAIDEHLFRRVMDACSVAFYTWPAENWHFTFLTNKWSLDDMQKMLDMPSLQQMADEIKMQLEK